MSDPEPQLWVNTLFRGRQLAEFLAVKKHLGIQSNTDVIRHLIHKQARALRRRSHQPRDAQPPAHHDEEKQEPAGPEAGQSSACPDVRSLCFSCSLPDCDETDSRCLYQQAIRRRARRD